MRFVSALLLVLVSLSAHAVELINPWKGGSQGVELHQMLTVFLEKNNVEVKVVNIDNCRLLPTVWKQHRSPIVINWSDSKECNMNTSNITIISQGTQVFCSLKEVNSIKKPIKIGWQSSAPLTGLYESFEKEYGQLIKVPYQNSGQQIQGVISGEIDIALIGQGSGLTSNLSCWLAAAPLKDMKVFDYAERDMYLSLLAVMYEDSKLQPLIESFVRTQEIISWRDKRSLVFRQVPNEKQFYLSNTFDRR